MPQSAPAPGRRRASTPECCPSGTVSGASGERPRGFWPRQNDGSVRSLMPKVGCCASAERRQSVRGRRDCAHVCAGSSAHPEGTDLHRCGPASRCHRRPALAAIRDLQRRTTNMLTPARGFCAVRSGTRLPRRASQRMRPPSAAGANHHARLWPSRRRYWEYRAQSQPTARKALDATTQLANPARGLASDRWLVATAGLAAAASRLAVVATAPLVIHRTRSVSDAGRPTTHANGSLLCQEALRSRGLRFGLAGPGSD